MLAGEVEKVLAPGRAAARRSTRRKTPFVILVVGVNGTGKTTTIGKLAARFRGEGRSVMLAAGDTFRAAAIEQLKIWGERARRPGRSPARPAPTPPASPSTRWRRRRRPAPTCCSSTPPAGCRTRRS